MSSSKKKRYLIRVFLVLYVGLYVCFKGQISGILRTITSDVSRTRATVMREVWSCHMKGSILSASKG